MLKNLKNIPSSLQTKIGFSYLKVFPFSAIEMTPGKISNTPLIVSSGNFCMRFIFTDHYLWEKSFGIMTWHLAQYDFPLVKYRAHNQMTVFEGGFINFLNAHQNRNQIYRKCSIQSISTRPTLSYFSPFF